MSESSDSARMPARKALEAAAINRLVEMNKGQKVQPSQEAVLMAAKFLANRAFREGSEVSTSDNQGSVAHADPSPSLASTVNKTSAESATELPPMCSNLLGKWLAQDPEKT